MLPFVLNQLLEISVSAFRAVANFNWFSGMFIDLVKEIGDQSDCD